MHIIRDTVWAKGLSVKSSKEKPMMDAKLQLKRYNKE